MTLVQQQQQQAVSDASAPTQLGVAQDQPIALKVSALQQRYAALTQVKATVLKDGTDYGKVGDSQQDALRQPGAQKLAILFGLHADFQFVERDEDWTGAQHGGEPFFRYLIKCTLTDEQGQFVADSYGEINSWDSKYRWRWVEAHKVPDDVKLAGLRKRVDYAEEFVFAIDKAETGGKYGKPPEYWQMFRDAQRDGKAISITKPTKNGDRPAVRVETVTYRLSNDDVFSQVNTMIKMAQKRALVGAILIGTGASEFFTQDLDDMDETTLENMGIRQTRTPAGNGNGSGESDITPPTRQGRAPEPPARPKNGNDSAKIDWHKAPGSNLVPAIRRITKINDLPTLFAMLEAAGSTINLSMTADQIAAIITNAPAQPPAPPADEDQPPAPVESPVDTAAADEPSPDDLPF